MRIGIINLMPRAAEYEARLLSPLRAAGVAFEPRLIRLSSHAYQSSDAADLAQRYVTFEQAGPLDGLIVTGAPVEEIDYHAVTYWSELSEILDYAEEHVRSTLGLCWGGMVLAQRLGIAKEALPRKLFGVLPLHNHAPRHPLLLGSGEPLWCPQSRHAGLVGADVAAASAHGELRVLADSDAAGCCIFERTDGRMVGHLGHPEYEPERLLFEYARDRAAGRGDVNAPDNVDLTQPSCWWRDHRLGFFAGWLKQLCVQT